MGGRSLYDKADKKLQRVSATIGAIIVIVGAATGICTWVSNQFQSAVSSQISDLQGQVEDSDRKTEIQITRLELMMLIDTQPENTAEIEKVAKHYFQDLGGDWYMTNIYSTWCRDHRGDPSIVTGVK